MLKNVPVNSISISRMGGFQNSKLQKFELEYILAHIVRMSQQKGEWVTEFTLQDFFSEFDPGPAFIQNMEEFRNHFQQLLKKGYLEPNEAAQTIKVTDKFAELCEEYSC